MSFSLQKGFLHLFSGSILGRAISFLLNIVLSRFLGPSSLGLYALALNAIQSFELFTKLGLDYGLSLELTSNSKNISSSEVSAIESKVINQSLSLIIISSLVGVIGFGLWLLPGESYFPQSIVNQRTIISVLLLIACFLESINSFLWDILLAKALTRRYSIRIGIVAPLKIVFYASGYFLAGIVGAFLLLAISSLATWCILLRLLPLRLGTSFRFGVNPELSKHLLSKGKALYFVNTINALVFLPLWSSLASTSGLSSVGYLRIGQLMVQFFSLVPSALLPAYFLKLRLTVFSGENQSSTQSQVSFLSQSSSIAWTAALALLSVYFLIDTSLTTFLFGHKFVESITTTRIFLVSSVFDSASGFYQTFYLASEMSSVYLLAQLLPSFIIVLLFVSSMSSFGLKSFLALKLLSSLLPLVVYLFSMPKSLTNSLGNIIISLTLCSTFLLPPDLDQVYFFIVILSLFFSLLLLAKSCRTGLLKNILNS
tara:strand:- start:9335 stop:10786 length:1452 start_codon:yes stop_codon:yes gene_type:complete